MLDRIEFFIEYIEVEWSEFRLRHENIMADANEAQGVEAVQLNVAGVVQHEEERCLEHFFDRVSAAL